MGKLTDRQIQDFTYPKDQGRHADGASLFLDVRSGSKVWVHRYRWKKPSGEWSEKTVTIGHYPQAGWKARLPVGLAEARRENARLRALEAQGVDPALQRKEEKAEALNARLAEEQRAKAGISFEDFVCEWMDKVSECSRGTETEYAYRPETARAILREWREEKYPPPVVANNWQRCMGLLLFLLSPLEPGSRGQRQEPGLKKISPR